MESSSRGILHDFLHPDDDPRKIETCCSLFFDINNSNKHIVYLIG